MTLTKLTFTFSLLCILLSLNSKALAEESKCVFRGHEESGKLYTYDGPPQLLRISSLYATLDRLCPDLKTYEDKLVCCDDTQVIQLSKSIDQLESSFRHCPSCFTNILNPLCMLTCSRNQSAFLKVTNTSKLDSKDYITALSFFVNNDLVEGIFNSCKDVSAQSGTEKIISLLCGFCNPHKWFQLFINVSMQMFNSRLGIVYNFSNNATVIDNGKEYYPVNTTSWLCTQSPGPGKPGCLPKDCHYTPSIRMKSSTTRIETTYPPTWYPTKYPTPAHPKVQEIIYSFDVNFMVQMKKEYIESSP